MLLYGINFDRINRSSSKFSLRLLKLSATCILIFLLGVLSIITIYGRVNTTNFNEDAVVILGCGIQGDKISAALRYRLDKGVDYYHKNTNSIIVVSGGQGPQEFTTEANAMEKYLLSKGIPPTSIVKEDHATSTYENFLYSKRLLDKYFKRDDYNITYITNNFHSYRAGRLAKAVGLNPTSYNAPVDTILVIPANMREFLAVIKYWIFSR